MNKKHIYEDKKHKEYFVFLKRTYSRDSSGRFHRNHRTGEYFTKNPNLLDFLVRRTNTGIEPLMENTCYYLIGNGKTCNLIFYNKKSKNIYLKKIYAIEKFKEDSENE